MKVSIYYAVSRDEMQFKESFKCNSLAEARQLVAEWFEIEIETAQWNIRSAHISETALEARIDGFCKDERVIITLEDKTSKYPQIIESRQQWQ